MLILSIAPWPNQGHSLAVVKASDRIAPNEVVMIEKQAEGRTTATQALVALADRLPLRPLLPGIFW